MNMLTQPALAGTTPLCLVAEPIDKPERAKNKFRVGEIVELHDGRLAVVLPSGAKRGKDFFRFMYSEEIEGEYHSRISMSLKSDNYLFEQMGAVTPTLKLEEPGCHLHALLTTNPTFSTRVPKRQFSGILRRKGESDQCVGLRNRV
jgi:hypothetical protein